MFSDCQFLADGYPEDLHGRHSLNTRDRWLRSEGGHVAAHDNHLAGLGRIDAQVLTISPRVDIAELILGCTDVSRPNEQVRIICIF